MIMKRWMVWGLMVLGCASGEPSQGDGMAGSSSSPTKGDKGDADGKAASGQDGQDDAQDGNDLGQDGPGQPAPPSDDTSNGSGGVIGEAVKDAPCPGCRVFAPPSAKNQALPLLVALHGDEGNPSVVVDVWKSIAEDRNMILFAPQCPKEQGCKGSWWQWAGDPSWLDLQVHLVMNDYDVDLRRVYLTAWSGGATYGAIVAAYRGARYAAISLNSGGTNPGTPCLKCAPPMRWVVGEKDQLRPLVNSAYQFFTSCSFDTQLEVLDGKGHDLGSTFQGGLGDELAGWMLEHQNECAPWPR